MRFAFPPYGLSNPRRSSFELHDQWQDRMVEIGLGQRPDMLVADAAQAIDDEGLGDAVDPPIDADAPVVGADPGIGIAERGDPGERRLFLVLVIDAVDRDALAGSQR